MYTVSIWKCTSSLVASHCVDMHSVMSSQVTIAVMLRFKLENYVYVLIIVLSIQPVPNAQFWARLVKYVYFALVYKQ